MTAFENRVLRITVRPMRKEITVGGGGVEMDKTAQ
jgi:hypothetical protein